MDKGRFIMEQKLIYKLEDLLEAGKNQTMANQAKANFVYFSATMDAAIWGAELALGDSPQRIYQVEPTGVFEDDPNVTNKKFPGNPTRSYRTRQPIKGCW